jgi:hypothetical protein
MRALGCCFLILTMAACGSAGAPGGAVDEPDAGDEVSGGSGGAAGSGGATAGQGGSVASGGSGGASFEPDAGSSSADAGSMADASAPQSEAGGNPSAGNVLFDGKTLDGWEGNTALWSVKEGVIDGNTQKGGQLLNTKQDYDDFRFLVTSRLLTKGNHLGVCMFGSRSATFGYGGCMLVIPPQGGSWDYQKGGGLAGAKTFPHPAYDVSQWHQAEILGHLKDGTIRMAVDGVEVLQWKDANPGRLKKGPIGLQIHAGASEVQYKDISVEVAPKEDRLITVKN